MIEAQRDVDPLELARALLDNGDALLSDAAYLLSDERRARAAALALMASEEFSKLYLCLNAITGEAEVPSATSREWRNHQDKLETAKALELAFIDPNPNFDMERAKAEVASLRRLKMSCTYVDHESGHVRRPGDDAVDAAALIANGRAKSAFLHSIFDRITPEVMLAMNDYRDLLANVIDRLTDEHDPEATVGRLRSLTAAAITDDPDAIQVALLSALQEVHEKAEPETQSSASTG